jgi:hypothetical protein
MQLSKYPTLINLEKQAGIPKAYAVIGLGALYFFLIIFNLGGQLLTNLAGFVIPGYYSMQALFTSSSKDDTQWLTVSNQPIAQFCSGNCACVFLLLTVEAVLGCFRLLHRRRELR